MTNSHYWVGFDVDFSKSETELANEFKQWLRGARKSEAASAVKKPKAGRQASHSTG